jgi:cytochrome P450
MSSISWIQSFYDKLYSNDRQANKWEWQAKQFGVPGSIYATVDHETHRLRAVLNQFFSMQRARQLQPVVQERVDALVERFAQYKDTGRIIQLEMLLQLSQMVRRSKDWHDTWLIICDKIICDKMW